MNDIFKLKNKLIHISFEEKCRFCCSYSVDTLKNKYIKEKSIIDSNCNFIAESLFELLVRCGEGLLLPYSKEQTIDIMNSAIEFVYNSQIEITKLSTPTDFMYYFSLWQMEEQEDIFVKFFRYDFFFNFKNEKIDMQQLFFHKFNTTYDKFIEFSLSMLSLYIFDCRLDDTKFHSIFEQYFLEFKEVVKALSISKSDYNNLSCKFCDNLKLISFSMKISYSYPIIIYNNRYFIPLPHVIPISCSKSLLYRLTYNDNSLRSSVGKEVFESYVFTITNLSNKFESVNREYSYFIGKKQFKTPDVLCIKNKELLAIECKLLTPSAQDRMFGNVSVDEKKRILIDDLIQLYKALFLNNPIKFPDVENKYGLLLLFERFEFDHRLIVNEVINKLKLSDKDSMIFKEKIYFCSLYDFETLIFCNGDPLNEIKSMRVNNKMFNFSFTRTTCSSFYSLNEFINFKRKYCLKK